jgi:uncharacterized membrane protein
VHASRRVHASGDAAARERRFRTANLVLLLGAEYLLALVFAGVSLLPIFGGSIGAMTIAWIIIEWVLVLASLVVLLRLGQGGSRGAQPSSTAIGDRTADAQWRWGIFYVNRDDPALFVEKRFGIGYTLNFGNPRAWLVLALIAVAPIVSVLVAR